MEAMPISILFWFLCLVLFLPKLCELQPVSGSTPLVVYIYRYVIYVEVKEGKGSTGVSNIKERGQSYRLM